MEYIDLGLPSRTKWATCNVGASKSYEYGKYYNYDEALGLQTNEELIPSKEDWEELKNNCTFTWTTQNDTIGINIVGVNGNSIFLPAAGFYFEDRSYYITSQGTYWSSTSYKEDADTACISHLSKARHDIIRGFREYKRPIRLIKKKNNMEKRKIEIDLNTAKEWYNSSNESLKTIALQAFKEKELKESLPKTWKEWAEQNVNKCVYCINRDSDIVSSNLCIGNHYKNSLNTTEDCEAHLALIQLHVLRDAYRDSYQKGWKPDWSKVTKYCINYFENKLDIHERVHCSCFLSFPTEELAKQFLKNFKELIEKAKDLI